MGWPDCKVQGPIITGIYDSVLQHRHCPEGSRWGAGSEQEESHLVLFNAVPNV